VGVIVAEGEGVGVDVFVGVLVTDWVNTTVPVSMIGVGEAG
jgi:hypothetical protein